MAKTGYQRKRNQEAINTVGHNIRKYRNAAGMTIVQLSHLMDIEPKQLSRMELGETDSTITMITLAAEKLQVNICVLFDK